MGWNKKRLTPPIQGDETWNIMKKLILLTFAGLLCSAFPASADVLIYKHKISTTTTGVGSTARISHSGYTVFDPEAADEITQVLVNTKTKQFWLYEPYGITVDVAEGSSGRKYTFMIQSDSWEDTNDLAHVDIGTAKGVNSVMNIGGTSLWNIPKTFAWKGSATYPSQSGNVILEESTGSWSLDQKLSISANTAGDDLEDAVDRVRQTLIALGYTEI